MDPKIQAVLQKLEELKTALDNADAAGSSGWIRALWHAVEAARTDAITAEGTEAAAAERDAKRHEHENKNR